LKEETKQGWIEGRNWARTDWGKNLAGPDLEEKMSKDVLRG